MLACYLSRAAFRVNKIEQIDEVEELNLVLGHYAVCWATRGGSGSETPMEEDRAWGLLDQS